MKKNIFFPLYLLSIAPDTCCSDLTIPEGVLLNSGLSPAFVAKFALFIAILILWTTIIGKLLNVIMHIPIIAGQIIAGIILGPSTLNIKSISFFSEPFIVFDKATGLLYSLVSSDLFILFVLLLSAAFTVPYLLWLAGHETNIQDIVKVGFTAVSAGFLGATVPILFIILIYLFFGFDLTFIQSMGLGIIFSATSVSIPIAMLFSRNKMHLQSSKATLGAAVIDDIFAVILLAIFFIFLQSGVLGITKDIIIPEHTSGIASAITYIVFAFAILCLVGYFIIPRVIFWLKNKKLVHFIPTLANGFMFLYFAFSELFGGLAGITGSYFAGLFHGMGDKRHTAEKTISPFVNAVLLPLFLGSIGLQLDVSILTWSHMSIVTLLLVAAILSKLGGCFIATSLSNIFGKRNQNKWRAVDSYLFGSSMVARGEVGIVLATILNGSRAITSEQYVISVLVIILTTIVSPIMLASGFNWFERLECSKKTKVKDIAVKLGLFDSIGTVQMFNIIVGIINASPLFKESTISFSEGQKIADLEAHNVKIILSPSGIIFEGNGREIKNILAMVKQAILTDLEVVDVLSTKN